MATDFHACWLPRRGNSLAEYEDAFAADAATGRFAVSDGATESAFAGLWARMLVEEFMHSAPVDGEHWLACLGPLQQGCREQIDARPLPWYVETKLAEGAFATLLGVVLTADPCAEPHWQAMAVGDSCLFHTRGDALLTAFPLDHSTQFNSRPKLVGSRTSAQDICDKKTRWAHGTGRAHDRLWLMTDALAQWCLMENEAGRSPWREMESLLDRPEDDRGFAMWIEDLRDRRQLHNDDVTVLGVSM